MLDLLVGRLVGQKVPAKTRAARAGGSIGSYRGLCSFACSFLLRLGVACGGDVRFWTIASRGCLRRHRVWVLNLIYRQADSALCKLAGLRASLWVRFFGRRG